MKRDIIARKERWARIQGQRPQAEKIADRRLPPGQREVPNFPVLDLGWHPNIELGRWRLRLLGRVDHPVTLDWERFQSLPQIESTSDFHCVTAWSRLNLTWRGVPFSAIVELAKPHSEAKYVFFKGYDGYTTNSPLAVCAAGDVLLAHSWNGQPLTAEHGGPARVIIPSRYAWKGTKFVREIVFLKRDVPGFWELRGYSNSADPWKAERFASSD